MKVRIYKNLNMDVYNSIIHDSSKVETTQMSNRWQMDKKLLVYP